MTNQTERNLYTVVLMDNDPNLPTEKALVATFENIVSSDTHDVIIQEIIMNEDVKGLLEKHNKLRQETINRTILNNTGKKVYLEPLRIKDLTWMIK